MLLLHIPSKTKTTKRVKNAERLPIKKQSWYEKIKVYILSKNKWWSLQPESSSQTPDSPCPTKFLEVHFRGDCQLYRQGFTNWMEPLSRWTPTTNGQRVTNWSTVGELASKVPWRTVEAPGLLWQFLLVLQGCDLYCSSLSLITCGWLLKL